MGEDDCTAEFGEELRRDGAGGPVGAVDDDALSIERKIRNGTQQGANVLGAVGLIDWKTVFRCPLSVARWRLQAAEDFGFDGQLGRIGQFVSVGAEELDAVVLPGIVRGGDDDAGGKFVRACKEGDSGSGNDSRAFDRRAAGNQASGQRGGDPVGGLSRVLSDQDARRIA